MTNMEVKKGKIVGFQGSWMSGIATLVVKNLDTGTVEYVRCENAPTVRALDSAFGNVIVEGHMVDNKALKGKEIFYSLGDFGLLEAFTPVKDASPELLKVYEKGRAKRKLKKVS